MFGFLNNPATVWVLVPVAAIVMSAFRPMIRSRARERDQGPTALEAQQARQIEILEQRLQVLERIVTDNSKGNDLAAQIEQLRELPSRQELRAD